MYLEQTFRWYGPNDPVLLSHIRQAGATGIVSALHHIPVGEVWSTEEIRARKEIIEAAGLRWSVVESVPVHEDIKQAKGNRTQYIEHYKTSIRNLAAEGIQTICYNFMPVLDWTRTDLDYLQPDGSTALFFNVVHFAAFDVFIFKRKGAEKDFTAEVLQEAEAFYKSLSKEEQTQLFRTIIAGLPGSDEHYTEQDFADAIAAYDSVPDAALRENLYGFLREIVPVAEEEGVKLAIHPDDPPYPLLGIPRVVSTKEDAQAVMDAYSSPSNGICFCTGSYGAREDNDLVDMVKTFAPKINFYHLRAVNRLPNGSFYEDNHLEGSPDMFAVMQAITEYNVKTNTKGIPMRPDHGHRMLDDLPKQGINPGYTGIGRMRGLAELRGLELAIARMLKP